MNKNSVTAQLTRTVNFDQIPPLWFMEYLQEIKVLVKMNLPFSNRQPGSMEFTVSCISERETNGSIPP